MVTTLIPTANLYFLAFIFFSVLIALGLCRCQPCAIPFGHGLRVEEPTSAKTLFPENKLLDM